MRVIAILALVALSGCVEPPPPSQAQVAMEGACDRGDMNACRTIVEMEQRERERISSIPPPVITPYYLDPADFRNEPMPAPAPAMKVCPNGMIVQQSYFC